MPIATTLLSYFRLQNWGREAESQYELVYLAGSSQTGIDVQSPSNTGGMIIYGMEFYDCLPRAFSYSFSQEGRIVAALTLAEPMYNIPSWCWVSPTKPMRLTILNRLGFSGFLSLSVWTLVFDTIQAFDQVHKESVNLFGPAAGQSQVGRRF